MEYIDLGLPSGTLWAEENEGGYYNFDEAVEKYGDSLPTREQFEELISQCKWEWTGNGYKVTGPNGNYIVLPAAGYLFCSGFVGRVGSYCRYWSSTPVDSYDAWEFWFDSISVNMDDYSRDSSGMVRLVENCKKQRI